LGDQVFKTLFDNLVVVLIVGRAFMSLAGGQEGEETKCGGGNIVGVLASARAIAPAMLGEIIESPVAVRGLVASQPFEPSGNGSLGDRIAAAFTQHLLASGAASAGESAWNHLGATISARIAERAGFPHVRRINTAALTAAETRRWR